MSGIISAEGESISLNNPINVNEGEKKGNVERWLSEIEGQMFETMKKMSISSLNDNKTKRTEWVLKWPAQSILLVDMIKWTSDVEKAISSNQLPKLLSEL